MKSPIENPCVPVAGLSKQGSDRSIVDDDELEGGRAMCHVCSSENIDHLIFECSMAKFVWSFLGEALGWQSYLRNMDDLIAN
jgi:hypothetical protein